MTLSLPINPTTSYHYCTPTSGEQQWAASPSPAGRSSFSTKMTDIQKPEQNSPQMFAIREDEEQQHWLYVWHKGRWPLVSEKPFETQGEAVSAAVAYSFNGR